jgi:putative hydrolase of HD superfamily
MVDTLEKLNRLKRTPRMGWLECEIPPEKVEDVAQHSFEAVSIVLLLLDELEREGRKLDRERALSMAVTHDWAEALTGDFSATISRQLGEELRARMESEALDALVTRLPERKRYLDLWKEYQEDRTPEAKLVHAADHISILIQALGYRERGNQSKRLEELWRVVHEDLKPYMKEFPPVKKFVEKLDERYRKIT